MAQEAARFRWACHSAKPCFAGAVLSAAPSLQCRGLTPHRIVAVALKSATRAPGCPPAPLQGVLLWSCRQLRPLTQPAALQPAGAWLARLLLLVLTWLVPTLLVLMLVLLLQHG